MLAELLVTLTVAFVAYVYVLCKSKYAYFTNMGVKNLPVVPILGNSKDMVFRLKHRAYVVEDNYKAFPNERLIGFFDFLTPSFMVRDPDLIKQITVKDFDHFVDHRSIVTDKEDMIGSSLFFLNGDKWRDMRSTLSPAFTGSKMRNMCPFMVECGHQVVDYLTKQSIERGGSILEVELKDLFTRFATDIIASSAFGCKVNSLEQKNNEFFKTGFKMTDFSGWRMLKSQINFLIPALAKIFNLSFTDASVTGFFKNILYSTIKYREENKVVRHDMINILMEVKKGSLKYEAHEATDDAGFATVEESEVGKRKSKRVWTDEELASQLFIFFFAGFETVSTLLSFTAMELAMNPDIQDRLREEVDATYPESGDLTYETIQKLDYLDMVVSEGLRMWSPSPSIDRRCVKTYNVPDKNGKKTNITIEEGTLCIIPTRALHYDPQYWEEPRKFNPERFSADNKHNITPFTYIPFGSGPRNCIGSRFALMEVKCILYYIVRNFKLETCDKTMNPMVFPSSTFSMKLENGSWVKIVPRKNVK